MPPCGLPSTHRAALVVEQDLAPAGGQFAAQHALELRALGGRQRSHALGPRGVFAIAAAPGGTPRAEDVFGNLEGRMRPVERLPRRCGVFRMQSRAVAAALPLQARDALRNHRAAGDHRRPRILLRRRDRVRHGFDVVAVDLDDMPVGDAKARGHVFADRQRRAAVVGDAVVVPEEDQLAQPQVTRERDHLLADPLLQAAVADEGVGGVVDQARAEARIQVGLRNRHAERIRDALARAGPVVTSMPLAGSNSGCPSQCEPSSRKVLIWSIEIAS